MIPPFVNGFLVAVGPVIGVLALALPMILGGLSIMYGFDFCWRGARGNRLWLVAGVPMVVLPIVGGLVLFIS